MAAPISRSLLALAALTGLAEFAAAGPDGPDLPPYIPVRAAAPAEELPAPHKLPAEVDRHATAPAPAPTPIDLASALRLGGEANPEIVIAEQRVVEAVAVHQLAAAQLLPSLNLGLNYDSHTGPLQTSSGNILKVDRSALYIGAGANAVAAGTVNVPGLVYNFNVSEAIFACLISKQDTERARFAAVAERHEVFRRVAGGYVELLRAKGRRSIAQQTRDEAAEVARVTAVFVKAGQAAQADGDRTANELTRRQTDLAEAAAEVLIASARLAELLALDQALYLHPVEEKVVPAPIVPDPIPLEQLLAIALLQRPELGEWQTVVREALLALDGAKLLPFSPNLIVGLSGGDFGGGGPLAAPEPRFGNFGTRNNFDAVAYWTLQNLGCGNLALVKTAASRIGLADLEKLRVLNLVRREVADAYVRTHARFLQIDSAETAIRTGQAAFNEDFRRILGGLGRPIELLESLRLLGVARNAYLDAIVEYNQAQIDLYVALGKPPADMLARPVRTNYAAPLPEARRQKGR
jgi:outer membrane protein TolC